MKDRIVLAGYAIVNRKKIPEPLLARAESMVREIPKDDWRMLFADKVDEYDPHRLGCKLTKPKHQPVIDDLEKVLKPIWKLLYPRSEASDWSAIWSKPGGKRQAPHMDYQLLNDFQHVEHETVPAALLIALEDGTKIHTFGWNRHVAIEEEEEVLVLQRGNVAILRGDLIHAGAPYEKNNLRIHAYLDVDGDSSWQKKKVPKASQSKEGSKGKKKKKTENEVELVPATHIVPILDVPAGITCYEDDNKNTVWVCPFCDVTANSAGTLRTHINRGHGFRVSKIGDEEKKKSRPNSARGGKNTADSSTTRSSASKMQGERTTSKSAQAAKGSVSGRRRKRESDDSEEEEEEIEENPEPPKRSSKRQRKVPTPTIEPGTLAGPHASVSSSAKERATSAASDLSDHEAPPTAKGLIRRPKTPPRAPVTPSTPRTAPSLPATAPERDSSGDEDETAAILVRGSVKTMQLPPDATAATEGPDAGASSGAALGTDERRDDGDNEAGKYGGDKSSTTEHPGAGASSETALGTDERRDDGDNEADEYGGGKSSATPTSQGGQEGASSASTTSGAVDGGDGDSISAVQTSQGGEEEARSAASASKTAPEEPEYH